MNTIERLAELAKGATQGKWRYLNSNAGYRFVLADDSDRYALAILHPDDMRATLMTDANGTYIAACNPAAIAQAAAEYAELERRNVGLVEALSLARRLFIKYEMVVNEPATGEHRTAMYLIDAALARSAQEKADHEDADDNFQCPGCLQRGCGGECMMSDMDHNN